MKKVLYLLTFLFLILILLFPSQARNGASNGLLLWFNILLPTLLPFLILSDLLRRSQSITSVCRKISLRTGKNLYFLYPLLLGLLCGLPLGSKLVAEAVRSGQLSHKTGQFLLTVCNNSSAMFLMGYVAEVQLQRPDLSLCFLLTIPLSSLIAGALLSFPVLICKPLSSSPAKVIHIRAASAPPFIPSVTDSIMDSFRIIVQIGGFVILFSVLAEFVLLIDSPLVLPLIASLEITSGIRSVCSSELTQTAKILLSAGAVSFTGLSGIAQTACVLSDSGLSLPRYVLSRLLSALFAVLLFFLIL